VSDNVSHIKCPSASAKESEKLFLDPHPNPDQHEKLIILEGHPLPTSTIVWSTSVNAFASYPAHRQNK